MVTNIAKIRIRRASAHMLRSAIATTGAKYALVSTAYINTRPESRV